MFNVEYRIVNKPPKTSAMVPVDLSDETMAEHKEKILKLMDKKGLDVLCVYGDREHGTNFGYLTGFEPRFEESLVVLHSDGRAFILLGNECLEMSRHARIEAEAIHVPHFSLPNQPMDTSYKFSELLSQAGLKPGMRTGLCGWKLFTGKLEDNAHLFDVPYFITEGIKQIIGNDAIVVNAADLFVHPVYGARTKMNANEIAHYEFGSSLTGKKVYEALEAIEVGKTELEIADILSAFGQPLSVQTICATGDRFSNAVVSPRDKKMQLGDPFVITLGLRGGLTHRTGYIAGSESDLDENCRDFFDRMAIPYFRAICTWYSQVGVGVKGSEIYSMIQETFPKEKYGWYLNPGHYTAGEEWLASPFYKESEVVLESGMMLQMDIIPSLKGYVGANAEDGVAIADKALRDELKSSYPEVMERFNARREYMKNELNIPIRDEILPMSPICGYYGPLFLEKEKAFVIV